MSLGMFQADVTLSIRLVIIVGYRGVLCLNTAAKYSYAAHSQPVSSPLHPLFHSCRLPTFASNRNYPASVVSRLMLPLANGPSVHTPRGAQPRN